MKKINFRFIFLFAAIFGLLVFLHKSGILGPVERAVQTGLNPVAVRFYSFSKELNIFYNDQSKKGDLLSEINKLEGRVEELVLENASFKKMEEENVKLRQYLRFFKDKEDLKYVLANVIAREASAGEEDKGDFIINRGRADGLRVGLAVIDANGALAGKIVAVEEKSARVTLVTNANCKLAAAILDANRTVGVTSGNLGLTVNLDFVPQTADIKIDDLVVTSVLDPGIPAGLVIGQVISVDKGTNEVWQRVSAEPIVNFEKLFIVAVILP